MRSWPMCLMLSVVIGGSAQAQDLAPDAEPPPDAPSITAPSPVGALAAPGGVPIAPGPALTPLQQANRDRIQGEREACRKQMRERGLRGDAVKAGVQECLSRVDPVAGARMKCMQVGLAKGLSGPDLWASVRQCMRPS